MKVLLSIKPEFANKIFDGTKKYEFRKTIFKNSEIKTIIVYSSSPIQKVIGEFDIETIISADIEPLWEKTKQGAGINKEYYDEYFSTKTIGHAIKIKNTRKYKEALSLKDSFNVKPPQSFMYVY